MQSPKTRPSIRRSEWSDATARASIGLSRTVLRSPLPAYLLAASATFALGGFVTWEVVGQANAIHRAETTPPVDVTAEPRHTTPDSVIVSIPADPGAVGSRVTTTGALVPAPVVSAPIAPAPVAATPIAAAVSLPHAPSRMDTGVASKKGAAPSVTAVPLRGLTVLPAAANGDPDGLFVPRQ